MLHAISAVFAALSRSNVCAIRHTCCMRCNKCYMRYYCCSFLPWAVSLRSSARIRTYPRASKRIHTYPLISAHIFAYPYVSSRILAYPHASAHTFPNWPAATELARRFAQMCANLRKFLRGPAQICGFVDRRICTCGKPSSCLGNARAWGEWGEWDAWDAWRAWGTWRACAISSEGSGFLAQTQAPPTRSSGRHSSLSTLRGGYHTVFTIIAILIILTAIIIIIFNCYFNYNKLLIFLFLTLL